MLRRLDVTVTATLRPALFELTLWSFERNLFSQLPNTRLRLIVNLDPLWGNDRDAGRLIDIGKSFVPDVIIRQPPQPSFGEAVRWLWTTSDSEWLFHLEDDWILLRRIDPDRLFAELKQTSIAQVRFNRDRNPLFPGKAKFSLNPSFLRRSFIESVLPALDPEKDPEKQIARGKAALLAAPWRYRVHGRPLLAPIVLDTGRFWREQRRIAKNVDQQVTTWHSSGDMTESESLRQRELEKNKLWREQVRLAKQLPPV